MQGETALDGSKPSGPSCRKSIANFHMRAEACALPIETDVCCDFCLQAAIRTFQTRAIVWDMIREVSRTYQKNKEIDRKKLIADVVPAILACCARVAPKPRIVRIGRDRQGTALGDDADAATNLVRSFADGFEGPDARLPRSDLSDKKLLVALVLPTFRSIFSQRTHSTAGAARQDLDAIFGPAGQRMGQWLSDNRTVAQLNQSLYELECRHGCVSLIRSFASVIDWVGNRLGTRTSSQRRSRESFRLSRGRAVWDGGKHCRGCERPTQLTHARVQLKRTEFDGRRLSNIFCEKHVQTRAGGDRHAIPAKLARFESIRQKIWSEIESDPQFFRRFVPFNCENQSWGTWNQLRHEKDCHLILYLASCGHGDPDDALFFHFESNVRLVARLIAERFPTSLSVEVDRLVHENGLALAEISKRLDQNPKLVKKHSDIAVARIINNAPVLAANDAAAVGEIATRLDISVADARHALRRIKLDGGTYDFSPARSAELVWWPNVRISRFEYAGPVTGAGGHTEPVSTISLDDYLHTPAAKSKSCARTELQIESRDLKSSRRGWKVSPLVWE